MMRLPVMCISVHYKISSFQYQSAQSARQSAYGPRFHASHIGNTLGQHQSCQYTWPGSSWRPSACEADVIAARPQVHWSCFFFSSKPIQKIVRIAIPGRFCLLLGSSQLSYRYAKPAKLSQLASLRRRCHARLLGTRKRRHRFFTKISYNWKEGQE